MINKYFEFVQADLEPIKSFYIKDELNPKIWNKFEINKEIRIKLLKIGEDFYSELELNADVLDIVLVGSLCNYNWSEKYSDFDLHVIIKYSDIDDNLELVEKYCDYAKKIWNVQHEIQIEKYDVEIMLQDINSLKEGIETDKIGGAYSILKDKWVKMPKKVDFIPDEKGIQEKAHTGHYHRAAFLRVYQIPIRTRRRKLLPEKYFAHSIPFLWYQCGLPLRQSGLQ